MFETYLRDIKNSYQSGCTNTYASSLKAQTTLTNATNSSFDGRNSGSLKFSSVTSFANGADGAYHIDRIDKMIGKTFPIQIYTLIYQRFYTAFVYLSARIYSDLEYFNFSTIIIIILDKMVDILTFHRNICFSI